MICSIVCSCELLLCCVGCLIGTCCILGVAIFGTCRLVLLLLLLELLLCRVIGGILGTGFCIAVVGFFACEEEEDTA